MNYGNICVKDRREFEALVRFRRRCGQTLAQVKPHKPKNSKPNKEK
jgi:hypothetical protein